MDPHDLASHISPVATAADILAARPLIDAVRVEPPVIAYLVALARATRESPSLSLGVSPRGTDMLPPAAQAWTWLIGRAFATRDEVKAMDKPGLQDRIPQEPEETSCGRRGGGRCQSWGDADK